MEIPQSWKKQLVSEVEKSYFLNLVQCVEKAYASENTKVFPSKALMFNAFEKCSFEATKVIVIGQDPYPTIGHANGLCFSVDASLKKLPKSLINIFKELQEDVQVARHTNGNLESWAEQGVLLLNSALSVEEGKPGSHAYFGWEYFTDAVIERLSTEKVNLVFILWGAHAQSKIRLIDEKKHLILTAPHPSPLAAYRGFFGSKPFSKTNHYLNQHGLTEIQW
jgi:uracil-DNA glycosylase